MARTLRRALALTTSVAFITLGTMVASPATAATDEPTLPAGVTLVNDGSVAEPAFVVSIDCTQLPTEFPPDVAMSLSLPIPMGYSVRLDLTGCASGMAYGISIDDRATPQVTALDGPDANLPRVIGTDWQSGEVVPLSGTQYLVAPNTSFVVTADDVSVSSFQVTTLLAVPVADPPGQRVGSIDVTIADDAVADMNVPALERYVHPERGFELGGHEGCGIQPGEHYWGSAPFEVTRAGTYTLRVVDVSPTSKQVDMLQASRTSGDPFIAVYRDFTPSDAHQGVLGCSDDARLDETAFFYVTSAGTITMSYFSQATVDLEPGSYTLVFAGYESAASFDPIAAPVGSSTTSEGLRSSSIEGWGDRLVADKGELHPTALGVDETGTVEVWFTPAAPRLAATGAAPSGGGSFAVGLALIAVGIAVLVARPRRA